MGEKLTAEAIRPWLRDPGHPLVCLDTVGSTNDYAKALANQGAVHGLAVAADHQTAGRGRMGRTFESPRGRGIYLTCLYRPGPDVPPAAALRFTPYAALAVRDAIRAVTGLSPGVKWVNDLTLGGKKLCGILTEMHVGPDGRLGWLITGVGVNVCLAPGDLSPAVAAIATDLTRALGHDVDRPRLCAALIDRLDDMYGRWAAGESVLNAYRAACVTLGREVTVPGPAGPRTAFAEDIDENYGLVVRYPDGRRETITAGEVSVR